MFAKYVKKLTVQHTYFTNEINRCFCTHSYNNVIHSIFSYSIKRRYLSPNHTYSRCHYILSNHYRINDLTRSTNHLQLKHFSVTHERLEDKTKNSNKLKLLSIKFPVPKTVLHNYFEIVSNELKSPIYKIIPQYKTNVVRNHMSWMCSYVVKWPEEMKFTASSSTKQKASSEAAMKALMWLYDNKKILDNGQPLIYDNETIKKVFRQNYIDVSLNDKIITNLNNICDTYESKISSNLGKHMQEMVDEHDEVSISSQTLNNYKNSSNKMNIKYLLDKYSVKEMVKLPIQKHKEEFGHLLENNRVIIVRGEPGCGKSTRIPQYVLEHWVRNMGSDSAKIIVTQPRRIATISLAERVANERNERVGDVVGYQVRLKSSYNPQTTRILYCTTGILLRQLQSDISLSDCTHIILDEAHERDVNTDLLMNLLRHALTLNPNLKLIVMSATIDSGLFQSYFKNAPIMNIPGFTYPVKMTFLNDIKLNLSRTKDICMNPSPIVVYEDVVNVISWIHKTRPEGAILCFLPGWDEISKISRLLEQTLRRDSTMILALHSKLSDSDQRRIFNNAPSGIRKIILATNIAETSVTIDDVVYVVDSGIHKEIRFDVERGVMCMDNHWISQSSVQQRKGRAGRVQPGESYHLYTKHKYKEMLKHSIPEILRVSLTKTVLDTKVYSRNMNAMEFFMHLPCPPQNSVITKAVEELTELELLDSNENLTPLGRALSDFQMPPKLAKSMVHSMIYKCVTPIVDIVTIFSSGTEMFSTSLTDKEGIKSTKKSYFKNSDHIAMMIIFERWLQMVNDEDFNSASNFCIEHNLSRYKLNTLRKLQDVHFEYLDNYLKNVLDISDNLSDNTEIIKGVLLSGVDTVLMCRSWDMVKGRLKNSNVLITGSGQKATLTGESVNSKENKYSSPFLLYINETRSNIRRTTLIRETSVIQPLTLLLFKKGDLVVKEVEHEIKTIIKDPVLLELKGTKFQFVCSRKDADIIKNTKNVLQNMQSYFIHQLTQGGQHDAIISTHWDKILFQLNKALATSSKC